MSFSQTNPYQSFGFQEQMVAFAAENERTVFMRRTYLHLLASVLMFAALETLFFTMVPAQTQSKILGVLFGNRLGMLALMVGFVGVSWVAEKMANSAQSLAAQYAGLGIYVLVEAIIFLPMLFVAKSMSADVIPTAAAITGIVFVGLTVLMFVTRADFSWLGRFLFLGGLVATGVVVCAMIFGFSLGLFFSAAMVLLACGYILYDTSNVMHRYRPTQYVAAALALFASVALLFYYVLRLVMASRSDD